MSIEGRIGLVGGGNMGSALIKGLINSGTATPEQITVAELDSDRGRGLAAETEVSVVTSAGEMDKVDLLIIAVKPMHVAGAAREFASRLAKNSLVITLAAGVPITAVAKEMGAKQAIARAMPNTPALVLKGATGIAANEFCGQEQVEIAQRVFAAVGKVAVVDEKLLDAVTGLSGSGPAYVFLFIESLADAGVRVGLDRATALTLASQTVAGAAELLIKTGQHPAELKDMVSSPGGTTITGLHVLEQGGFKGLIMDGVAAATERSQELGKKS